MNTSSTQTDAAQRDGAQTDGARWALPFFIVLYALLSLGLIFRVPIGAAPDEFAHLEYVQYIAQNNALPVFKPLGANHPGYEFHQPPLFYILASPAYKILSAEAAPYAARIVSLLCGAASLWLIWNAIVTLFPLRRELAIVATGFAALWPLHVAVGSFAGNDTVADLVCTAMFWKMALLTTSRGRTSVRDAAVVGALVGLGILSKNTTVVVGVVALLVLWLCARRNNNETDASHGGKMVLIALGAALLVGGPWMARNTILYGDAFAFRIFDEAFEKSSPRPWHFFMPEFSQAAGQQITDLIYLRALFLVLFSTWWGFFGGPETARKVLNVFGASGVRSGATMWLPIGALFLVATVLVLVGIARAVPFWRGFDGARKTALGGWMAGAVLVLLAFVYFNTTQFQGQARYLHPALLPITFGAAIGWTQLFRSPRALIVASVAFGILMAAMTLANIFGWRTLV